MKMRAVITAFVGLTFIFAIFTYIGFPIFKALYDGISDMPSVSSDALTFWDRIMAVLGASALLLGIAFIVWLVFYIVKKEEYEEVVWR